MSERISSDGQEPLPNTPERLTRSDVQLFYDTALGLLPEAGLDYDTLRQFADLRFVHPDTLSSTAYYRIQVEQYPLRVAIERTCSGIDDKTSSLIEKVTVRTYEDMPASESQQPKTRVRSYSADKPEITVAELGLPDLYLGMTAYTEEFVDTDKVYEAATPKPAPEFDLDNLEKELVDYESARGFNDFTRDRLAAVQGILSRCRPNDRIYHL